MSGVVKGKPIQVEDAPTRKKAVIFHEGVSTVGHDKTMYHEDDAKRKPRDKVMQTDDQPKRQAGPSTSQAHTNKKDVWDPTPSTNQKGYTYYKTTSGNKIQWNKPNNTPLPDGWTKAVENGVVVYKKDGETVYNKPGPNGKPRKVHYWKNKSGTIINNVDNIPTSNEYIVEAPATTESFPLLEGYCGIVNGNNSCYMNAIIQLLYSIPSLKTLFTNLKTSDKIRKLADALSVRDDRVKISDDDLSSNKSIFTAIGNIFIKIIYRRDAKTPIEKNKEYETLIGALSTKFDTSGKFAFPKGKPADARAFLDFFLSIFRDFKSTNKDFENVFKLLFLQEGNEYACINGSKYISDIKTYIPYINCRVRDNSNKELSSIQECIDNYISPESITPTNAHVDGCGALQSNQNGNQINFTTRTLILDGLDKMENVIITLDRFSATYTSSSVKENKLTNTITPDKIITINNAKFRIIGCARQHGSTSGGHYTYVAFDKDGKEAFIMDDTQVLTNDTRDTSKDGYIYLYERIKGVTPTSGGKRRKTYRRRQRRANKSRKNRVYRK